MAETVAPSVDETEVPAEGSPATGSRREALAAILRRLPGGHAALVVAVLLVLGSVWGVTGRQAGQAVEVTQGSLACTGTKAATRTLEGHDTPTQVMWLKPGMRCVLPVHLTNKGPLGVRVSTVVLPFMGTSGGAALQVKQVGHSVRQGTGVDGVYRIDRSLEPGDTMTLNVVVVFRKDGCTSRGIGAFPDFPRVGVRALRIGSTVSADAAIGFVGTAASTCSD